MIVIRKQDFNIQYIWRSELIKFRTLSDSECVETVQNPKDSTEHVVFHERYGADTIGDGYNIAVL